MIDPKAIEEIQYSVICARRLQYDNLMWQTPVVSLIGMSFLFTIALGSGQPGNRAIASVLAFFAALASAHLFAKHRYFEVHFANLLNTIESENPKLQLVNSVPKPKWPLSISAYKVWMRLFFLFAGAALLIGINNFIETSWGAKVFAPWR